MPEFKLHHIDVSVVLANPEATDEDRMMGHDEKKIEFRIVTYIYDPELLYMATPDGIAGPFDSVGDAAEKAVDLAREHNG